MSFVAYLGYGHGYGMPWKHTWALPPLSKVAAMYDESSKLIPVKHLKKHWSLLVLAAVATYHGRSGLCACVTLHVDYGATASNYCSLVSLRVINSTYLVTVQLRYISFNFDRLGQRGPSKGGCYEISFVAHVSGRGQH